MSGDIYDAADGEVIQEGDGSTEHTAHTDYSSQQHPSEVVADFPNDDQAMSIEDARRLLFEKNNATVSQDDPILLMVTLHQGFCKDYAKINKATIRQIEAMLQRTGNSYAEVVESLFKTQKGAAEQASIAHAIGIVKDFTKAFEDIQRAMRRHTILMTLLTILAVGSVVLPMAFSTP